MANLAIMGVVCPFEILFLEYDLFFEHYIPDVFDFYSAFDDKIHMHLKQYP